METEMLDWTFNVKKKGTFTCWLRVRDVMWDDKFNFVIQILKREHDTDQLESNSDVT